MKTKYFLYFLVIIISVFCLIACGGGGGGGGDDPDPPSTPWLCFTASENSTVSTKTIIDGAVSSAAPALEYSKDDGTTWTDFELFYYDAGDNLITAGTTVELASGEKMYIRAKGTNAAFSDFASGSDYRFIRFLLTGTIAASGNIMSLLDKDCKSTVIPSDFCFYILFQNCISLTSAPDLPATSLTQVCYGDMFYGCTSLIAAPELPATTLAAGCYSNMFQGCTSLTDAPVLPAKTLAYACYEGMFANCSALTTVPTLPATTLEEFCYNGMFDTCTSLVNAPEIKATSLANSSCCGMFIRCAALTKITVHFTDWNTAGHATDNWVTDVAAAGDFYCPAGLDTSVAGTNKNPAGWTIHELL